MNDHLRPLKQFGQNFLVDRNYINKIISAFAPEENDEILEIGPGQAALTRELVNFTKKIHVVEIDNRAAERIEKEFPNINLINSDFLKIDFKEVFNSGLRVIGNIPYNITSPILFKLLENRSMIIDSLLMVQYEVAKRITAVPGTKDYGILAVLMQNYADIELKFKVPPTVFRPVPKVDSAIIHLKWKAKEELNYNEELFKQLVKSSFSQRRKTLKNSLKNSIFANCDFTEVIDTSLRAERLSISDFIEMTKYFERKKL